MSRLALVALIVAGVFAQALRFEVASVKPANPSTPRPGRLGFVRVITTPGSLTARNATLKELTEGAYALEDYQVSGGPAWIGSAGFDVEGKSDGAANRDQLLLMLREFLASRFKLAVHRERKELAIYALVVGKHGPKFRALKASEASCWPLCTGAVKTNHMRYKDLPSLAAYLTRLGRWPGEAGRPVIDKTELRGDFDIDLDMTKIMEAIGDSGGPPTNASIYDSTVSFVEDQLGLRLEPQRAPIDVLVIDHAEKPSEN